MNIILQFRDKWLLLVIGVLYYFLVRLYIGPVDDILYTYLWTDGGIQFGRRIASLADALSSQCVHYVSMNGRFTQHTLIQYLCGMPWGREAFFVVSACCFPLLIGGLTQLVRKVASDSPRMPYDVFATLVVFLLLCPLWGNTLWSNVAFTVNYLWTATAFVWLLHVYLCVREKPGRGVWANVLLFFFAFWVGSMHEGFSLPLAGFFFLYYVCHPKQFRGGVAVLVVAYWLGTCLVAFAPANFTRAAKIGGEDTSLFSLAKMFRMVIALARGQWLAYFYLAVCVYVAVRFNRYRSLIAQHAYLFLVPLLSLVFAVLVAYNGSYQLFPTALMLTVLTMVLLTRLRIPVRVCRMGVWVAGVLLLAGYVQLYVWRSQIRDAWDAFVESGRVPGATYANARPMLEVEKQIPARWQAQVGAVYGQHILCEDSYERMFSALVADGDADRLECTLPDTKERLVEQCLEENRVGEHIYDLEDYLVAKYPADSQYSFTYRYPPSRLARLFHRKSMEWTAECDSAAHSFRVGDVRYTVVFLRWQDIILQEEQCEKLEEISKNL